MKTLLTILFLSTAACYAQTHERQSKKELEKTVLSQMLLIDSLEEDLKKTTADSEKFKTLALKMQRENETLRNIMKDYIKQIDDLNNELSRTKTELNKCKD